MDSLDVKVTAADFEGLPQDRKQAVLFNAVMGIDDKIDAALADHEDRLSSLESNEGEYAKSAAKSGLIGGAITMLLFLLSKVALTIKTGVTGP